MSTEIFLYAKGFHTYSSGSKKRPGPSTLKDFDALLDPNGKALLQRVLDNDFASEGAAALERAHLLAQRWDDAFLNDREFWSCLATYHRDVIRGYARDVSELVSVIALGQIDPEASGWRDKIQRMRDRLGALPGASEKVLEAHCKTLDREAFGLRDERSRDAKLFIAASHAASVAFSTWRPWEKANGVKVMTNLGRAACVGLERALHAVGEGHASRATPWCDARIRAVLEGSTAALSAPEAVAAEWGLIRP